MASERYKLKGWTGRRHWLVKRNLDGSFEVLSRDHRPLAVSAAIVGVGVALSALFFPGVPKQVAVILAVVGIVASFVIAIVLYCVSVAEVGKGPHLILDEQAVTLRDGVVIPFERLSGFAVDYQQELGDSMAYVVVIDTAGKRYPVLKSEYHRDVKKLADVLEDCRRSLSRG